MYSRKLGDQVLTFGHEGVLYMNSFVMYDKQTESLWVHTTGEAVKGKLKGKQLEFLPSVVTTWKKWRTDHENTTVLTGARARGMMGSFSLERAPEKYGLSIGQGRAVKLYPFSVLRERIVINDSFGGTAVVVIFDAESFTAAAFERGKRTFRFEDGKILDDEGLVWNALRGTCGQLSLKPIPATAWLTQRWQGFYPKGEVYKGD